MLRCIFHRLAPHSKTYKTCCTSKKEQDVGIVPTRCWGAIWRRRRKRRTLAFVAPTEHEYLVCGITYACVAEYILPITFGRTIISQGPPPLLALPNRIQGGNQD